MTILLDTTIVSVLMRGDSEASARFLALAPRDVLVPQPVLAEIEYGISRLRKSRRKDELDRRFRALSGALVRSEWTDEVSSEFGRIKAALERTGERIEDFDAAIAAHAAVERCPVATRNVRHFERVPGLAVESW